MNVHDNAAELAWREADRACHRAYGFGLDERPAVSAWEAKMRDAAIAVTHAPSYQKGQPTYRQRQKIQDYNGIARRYRALADAEYRVRMEEISSEIEQERANGTYVSPGVERGSAGYALAYGAMGLVFVCFLLAKGASAFAVISAASLAALIAYGCYRDTPIDDPRVAEGKRKRDIVHRYWPDIP